MSKIKSNRLEPRAKNGSLTIGNPESYTTFEGDVKIPGYATEEWVEDIVTGDIDVELVGYQKVVEKDKPDGYAGLDSNAKIPGVQYTNEKNVSDGYAGLDSNGKIPNSLLDVDMSDYQELSEKDQPGGYAGLNAEGKVPASKLDTEGLENNISDLTDQVNKNKSDIATNSGKIATNAAKIEQLESSTFQLMYDLDGKGGQIPAEGAMTINANDWASTNQIILNHTDANGLVNDFHGVHVGDSIWFADTTHDGTSMQTADTMGAYTVAMIENPQGSTTIKFGVVAESTRGAPTIGDRIAASIYPTVDVSTKADITYVDAQDEYIKENYLPLSGGDMTGDIYMKSKKIIGLPRDTVGNQAISVQGAEDRFMPIDAGDFDNYLSLGGGTMRGNINMDDHSITNAQGVRTTSDGSIKSRYIDSGQNSNLNLLRNGDTKVQVGSNSVNFLAHVQLNQPGTEPKHAVRMDQLPEAVDIYAPLTGDLDMASHRIKNLDTDEGEAGDAISVGVSSNMFLKRNGLNSMTNNLNMGGHRINNLASPSASADAATKFYVDNLVTSPAISTYAWKFQSWGGTDNPYPYYFKYVRIAGIPHLSFHYQPQIGPQFYSPNVLQGDVEIPISGAPVSGYDKQSNGEFRPAYMASGLFVRHSASSNAIVVQVEEGTTHSSPFTDERVYYWKLAGIFG